MNKNFEPIILETYAELCVRWRMAHVENQVQAGDFDAQLKSLEGVISAFNLAFPGAPASSNAPAKGERMGKPSKSNKGDSVILGD